MKTATISQTKNSLSALIDRARHGESILLTDRSRPVARLEPVSGSIDSRDEEGRLQRLERAGLIRRARATRLEEILHVAPPSADSGADVVQALVTERHASR